MEYISFMTKVIAFLSEFKAMINAMLTHNSFEKEPAIESIHRKPNQL